MTNDNRCNAFLIADSGSTKTDWCVVRNGEVEKVVNTAGMNPFFQTRAELEKELDTALVPYIDADRIGAIYFYGAGCTPEKAPQMAEALRHSFPAVGVVEVSSDLLAAARSLCGRQPGIACILGTGSNSCFYNGTDIARQVPALGFILGDEGGGANLGKLLVADVLKNQLPAGLKEKFFERFQTSTAQIIDRVYRQPFPNRYLASLNVFLEENKAVPEVRQLIVNAFRAFIRRNILQYDYEAYALNCVGSIALIYAEELQEAAASLGVRIGKIAKSPLEGLISYHLESK